MSGRTKGMKVTGQQHPRDAAVIAAATHAISTPLQPYFRQVVEA